MRISDWSSDVCSSDLADLRSPLSWPRHRRNCFHAFHVQPQAAAMIALVRTALARPLTFIVMAILIFGIGILAIARTPVDIFPRIGVPVISVAWSYNGLSPKDMAGRIITPYERVLSSAVNNIEHIESQSLNGVGVVKIYLQPGTDVRTATAQVTSISQTVLRQIDRKRTRLNSNTQCAPRMP